MPDDIFYLRRPHTLKKTAIAVGLRISDVAAAWCFRVSRSGQIEDRLHLNDEMTPGQVRRLLIFLRVDAIVEGERDGD